MSTSTIPGVDQITRHATRSPGDTVGALPVRRRITISAPAPATRLAYRHAEVNSHGSWATSHCTLEAESARRRCCADPQGTRTSGEMGTAPGQGTSPKTPSWAVCGTMLGQRFGLWWVAVFNRSPTSV